MNIGNNIQLLLNARNMTKKELAKVCDCDPSLITHYIKGNRKIPLEVVIKIANFFNITIDEVVYGKESKATIVVRCKNCTHRHWMQSPEHGKTIHYCSVLNAQVDDGFHCGAGVLKEKNDYGNSDSNK